MKTILMLGALLVLAACSHSGHSGNSADQSAAAGENEKGAMDDPGFLPRLFGQEPAPAKSDSADSEEGGENKPVEGELQED